MPLSSVAGQRVVLPLDGSKYFYDRIELLADTPTDILATALAALPFGIIRVRLAVEAGGLASISINGVPADAANGKKVVNATLGPGVYYVQQYNVAMPVTSLVAYSLAGTYIEVECWSGQS
jgi:hypothetical protein